MQWRDRIKIKGQKIGKNKEINIKRSVNSANIFVMFGLKWRIKLFFENNA